MKESTLPLSDKPNSNQSNLDGKNPLSKLVDTINSTSTVSDRTFTSAQTPANTISNNIPPDNQGLDVLNNMKAATDKPNSNQSNLKNPLSKLVDTDSTSTVSDRTSTSKIQYQITNKG